MVKSKGVFRSNQETDGLKIYWQTKKPIYCRLNKIFSMTPLWNCEYVFVGRVSIVLCNISIKPHGCYFICVSNAKSDLTVSWFYHLPAALTDIPGINIYVYEILSIALLRLAQTCVLNDNINTHGPPFYWFANVTQINQEFHVPNSYNTNHGLRKFDRNRCAHFRKCY